MSAFGALGPGQPQLLKQQIAQLLRGIQVYFVADGFIYTAFNARQLTVHIIGHFPQRSGVHLNAVTLHSHQHRQQRQFGFVHQPAQIVALQLRLKGLAQAQRHIGIGGGVIGGGGDVHLVNGDLLAPFAD